MPWGLYQYTVLPMGICNAPDIFQSIMSCLLGNLDWCHWYIDNIIIRSNGSNQDHLLKVEQVLYHLTKTGFRANVGKCMFGSNCIEYLGYKISQKGLHPQPKKVEAITEMEAPKTNRQLMFLRYGELLPGYMETKIPHSSHANSTMFKDHHMEMDKQMPDGI